MADDLQAISTVSDGAETRREQLSALLDAAPEGPVEEVAAKVEPEPEPAPEGQPRGDDGKFVAAAPATGSAGTEGDGGAGPAPVAEEPVWKRPPASWKKDFHEVWATAAADPKLAPLVQYAAQREEEMRAGIEPLIPKAKFADEMYKAIEPYSANQQAAGVAPVQAMQALMQADDILRNAPLEHKKAYALNLLSQYGITFAEGDLLQIQAAPPPQVNVAAIVDQRLSAWQTEQQDAVLQAEIDEFKKDKPDFDDLRPFMKALLNESLVPNLAKAYEYAKRLDDTSFAGLQAAHQAQAEAERRAAADRAAKNAKAAAVSVRSSTPGAQAPTKAQDRRSLIAAQLDEQENRF